MWRCVSMVRAPHGFAPIFMHLWPNARACVRVCSLSLHVCVCFSYVHVALSWHVAWLATLMAARAAKWNMCATHQCMEPHVHVCVCCPSRSLKKAEDIFQQLQGHMSQLGLTVGSCGEDLTPLRRALTCGLFPHAAKRQPDGSYKVRELMRTHTYTHTHTLFRLPSYVYMYIYVHVCVCVLSPIHRFWPPSSSFTFIPPVSYAVVNPSVSCSTS